MRIAIAVAFLTILAGCSGSRQTSAHSEKTVSSAGHLTKRASVVYPYSVMPGGVDSKEDIERGMASDRATAEHYREVEIATLHSTNLSAPLHAYVSYRKSGNIYWTSHKILIAAGEKVLSNGRDCIRGRCGNRISLTPRTPVMPDKQQEPTAEILDTPEVHGMVVDERAALPASVFSLLALSAPIQDASSGSASRTGSSSGAAGDSAGPAGFGAGPAAAGGSSSSTPPAILPVRPDRVDPLFKAPGAQPQLPVYIVVGTSEFPAPLTYLPPGSMRPPEPGRPSRTPPNPPDGPPPPEGNPPPTGVTPPPPPDPPGSPDPPAPPPPNDPPGTPPHTPHFPPSDPPCCEHQPPPPPPHPTPEPATAGLIGVSLGALALAASRYRKVR
jgi:hypothetical protein